MLSFTCIVIITGWTRLRRWIDNETVNSKLPPEHALHERPSYQDEEANIFSVAHFGIVADYKEVLPALTSKPKETE